MIGNIFNILSNLINWAKRYSKIIKLSFQNFLGPTYKHQGNNYEIILYKFQNICIFSLPFAFNFCQNEWFTLSHGMQVPSFYYARPL